MANLVFYLVFSSIHAAYLEIYLMLLAKQREYSLGMFTLNTKAGGEKTRFNVPE